ncbi:DegQ family serine endoprotease [Parendozoicomonas sp. Alg238-R29]|uniref:DegQ family serine endoprotease n=1 Tax=Parendozoicomonas sp. Alg238-R29 TaxID=2993446 RepID=UPI00248F000B|nr:DegQ family serine endoprotease [Parendozoicomonas sp. Alg238-R29]
MIQYGFRLIVTRSGTLLFSLGMALLCVFLLVAKPAVAENLPDFSTLAENASPAIVNISTMTKPKRDRGQMYGPYGEELPEILRRYFGFQIPDERGGAPQRESRPQPQSLGSGFIISKDGYVLTNNHVVDGADEIIVRLNDRSEYKAKLVGADKKSDLALLKVEGKNLPAVKIGDSDTLKPGQWVFAIGSPFGFDYSVTKGIISALNRSLPTENYVPFIQTDVPINPGNSGGPLLNMDGEVIGINSQIYTRSGGFMGLSFAIPIDDAMDVAKQLQEDGQVRRGWLGVMIQDVDRNLAESFGLKRPHGALLSQVLPDGPAAKSGLQAGDIITRFNGREIKFSSDLPIAVGRAPVGKKVDVVLMRRGKEDTISVMVGELPNEKTGSVRSSMRTDNRLGISVSSLDDGARARLGLDGDVKGVVVTEVGTGVGRAYGLRSGDVITHINHEDVSTTEVYQKITSSLPVDKTISMRLIRRGVPGFITFRLSA